jgi:hypothetical protein
LWQANGEQPHETAGPAPQMNVPHGTQEDREHFDPLSAGASKAIHQVRKNVGHPKSSFMRPFVELLGNIGTAGLRSSDSLMAQELGKQEFNPYAAHDAEVAQNMQIMQFLAQQEQARKIHELHQQQLAETQRYHMANEALYAQKALAPDKEALTEQAIANLQKKIPGAIPMSALPVGARTDAYKELRMRANKPAKLYPIQRTLDEMVKIADANPDLSTSFAAAVFPEHYKGGILNTAQLKSMPKEKRIAMERFNKLSNDLVVKQVHGLGSQRASIFLERIMKASNPHYGLTPEAIRAIRDAQKQDYDEAVADSKVTKAAISGVYYVPEMEPEHLTREEEPTSEPTPQNSQMVEITNKKTGERKAVTLEEARQLGALGE